MREVFIAIFATFIVMTPASAFAGEEEWRSIFNGENLDGWQAKIRGYPFGDNHLNTFIIQDGYLTVSYENYTRFDDKFGHLFYKTELSHYRLRFSYRFIGQQLADGPAWAYKNSGAMLHGQDPESMELEQSFPVSIEAQLLGADQGQKRTTANLCTPGTNVSIDHKETTSHCVYSSSASYAGEQWVQVEFEVLGDEVVRHWVNGKLVLEYTDLVVEPKEDEVKNTGPTALSSGYISLQSESHPVQFKDIELLEKVIQKSAGAGSATATSK